MKNLKFEQLSTDEMKDVKGGFNCGSGLTYFTGECKDGTEFSICASSQKAAQVQAQTFCSPVL